MYIEQYYVMCMSLIVYLNVAFDMFDNNLFSFVLHDFEMNLTFEIHKMLSSHLKLK